MGTKRPAPSVHPSRQGQVPPEPRAAKRHKPAHIASKTPSTTHPVNQLKTQIRSLRRLLSNPHSNLPADLRVTKERALQTAEFELSQNERAQKRNEMIGRWHKIRFFDRKKAMKRLKKAKKEFEGCNAQEAERRAELRGKAADAEVDVNYAVYYPLEKAYVSLFPRRKEGEEEEESAPVERKGDPEMWELVRQCMADGSLNALRNGRLLEKSETNGEAMSKDKKKHKYSQPERQSKQQEDEDDNDSDGGFFE